MPNHDEGHDDTPTIEVSGTRPKNKASSDGGGGAFYNFGGGNDAFHFVPPFFGDFGGGDDPSGQPPSTDGGEIVVTPDQPADTSLLSDWELLSLINILLDNLNAFDFGDYRLEVGLGFAQLEIYDYWNGSYDTYVITTSGASVISQELPSADDFSLPPGFQPSGPQFDLDYGYDFI